MIGPVAHRGGEEVEDRHQDSPSANPWRSASGRAAGDVGTIRERRPGGELRFEPRDRIVGAVARFGDVGAVAVTVSTRPPGEATRSPSRVDVPQNADRVSAGRSVPGSPASAVFSYG